MGAAGHSRHPKAVVPKLVRVVTQSKGASRSYYLQYLAVIAHNIEHCGFVSALPSEESHITPGGVIYPQFGIH